MRVEWSSLEITKCLPAPAAFLKPYRIVFVELGQIPNPANINILSITRITNPLVVASDKDFYCLYLILYPHMSLSLTLVR